MTRADHLAACKSRALALLAEGKRGQAFAAMVRGLEDHPGTRDNPGGLGGVVLALAGLMGTEGEVRRWIEVID